MNTTNKPQIALYATIAATVAVAVINAVIPFISPQWAGSLAVIASLLSVFLHQGAVSNAVASSRAQE